MAGQSVDGGWDRKRVAESAAKVVLAKHPAVVAGSASLDAVTHKKVSPKRVDVGSRNIGRGLQR